MNSVASKLRGVLEKVADTAAAAGRPRDSVRLLAVSKRIDLERIRAAYEAGQRDFGENYVQEWRHKVEDLPDDINWHFIGACQSNKAKYLVGKTTLIHSVDRCSLLAQLDKQAGRRCPDKLIDVLIEVNVGGESTKAGAALADLDEIVDLVCRLENIRLCGFMSLPPIGEDPESTRPYHRMLAEQLARTKDRLERLGLERASADLVELSMGTSDDYPIAVEEGATIVRVGTSVFGSRA